MSNKQISKDNREYWSNKLSRKFREKKELIESLHQNEINDQSIKNFPIFKKRLNVESELKNLLKAQKDFNEYSTNYRKILEQKRDLVRKIYNKVEDKLNGWSQTRKLWNNDNLPYFEEKDKTYELVEGFDKWLRGLCKAETKKAFYNSKKGKELQTLDELEEKATDLLHSDMIGSEVLQQISLIAKQTQINMTIPSETVKALPNG
tara:strand:+ start:551 stop:1165 length:615 start_codon:yes stop_codon:yes gene_type:complete